jgi:hypothetical protein
VSDPEFKPGDRVSVNLTGMVMGFCEGCQQEALALPKLNGEGYECVMPCDKPSEDRQEVMRLRDITEDDIEYPDGP